MFNQCQHVKVNYTRRLFSNKTHHLCLQCADCGNVVRKDNKTWLKSEDVPPNTPILEFEEKDAEQSRLF